MEELATSLLATLKRSSAPVETKLSLLNSLKSSIKHQRIPETAQPASIECIRIAISTQTSSSLVTAGFATLGHLTKRLIIQDQTSALFSQRSNILPSLLERLGDAREAHRTAAVQALCDLWPVRQVDVEKLIKENAIASTHPRLKEAGMDWVTKTHNIHQLQFRNFVPLIVECLEDAESTVRESAKANIIALFSEARDAAKADLKRQLVVYNVRKSIAAFILTQLHMAPPAETLTASVHSISVHSSTRPELGLQEQTNAENPPNALGSSTSSEVSVEPLYVPSQRELEDMFRQMAPCFEDKEKEDNWKARDTNVMKMRRLLQGNAPQDYHSFLVASIKTLLDGILKVANSLRTTMSTNGCQLVQELAKTLGSALDPMVDLILQGFEKMSASTKHISAQNADVTIDTIFARASYHIRLMQHIWQAVQDKNVQPRSFAAGWLKTLLKRQMQNKAHFESSGGLELADKSIRKALADANPKVREAMRATYWLFAQGWPDRGEAVMISLDTKSKQLLLKDPANPNGTISAASFTSSVGPAAAPNPRAAPSTSRSSLKETIAAQKKAALLAAKNVPERPSSAMSTFSPVRQAPPSAIRPNPPAPTTSQIRPTPSIDSLPISRPPLSSTQSSIGGLSSAPMRRPKRPELTRPATADLYFSNRKGTQTGTPPRSPVVGPMRNELKSPGSKSTTSNPEPTGTKQNGKLSRFTSPRASPVRATQQNMQGTQPVAVPPAIARVDSAVPSPTNEENMTIIIPNGGNTERTFFASNRPRLENDRTLNGRMSLPATVEEDNFTMVIPDRLHAQFTSVLDTIQAESTLDMQLIPDDAIDHQGVSEESQFSAIDFAVQNTDGILPVPIARFERLNEEDLIVFEDPTAADVIMPRAEEAARSALEELHLNSQIQAAQMENIEFPQPEELDDERPLSPSKTKFTAEQPLEDRAETLKTRRLVKSGIDRIRAHTLDAYGFRRLQELIIKTPYTDELPSTDLVDALVGYVQRREANRSPSQSLKSQALGCMRAVIALPLTGDNKGIKYADAICSLVMEAGMSEIGGLYATDLEKTTDEIIKHAGDQYSTYIDRMLQHDWRSQTADTKVHKGMICATLATLTKLMAASKEMGEQLSSHQRTQMSNLAVQCLKEVDTEVRKAGTEFCLEMYGAFGKGAEKDYWKAMRGAGEGQMSLVAYYLAKRKLM